MSTEKPLLNTPEGGTMSQPERPSQWHEHPYVWAFHATSGDLSDFFIESVCKQAKAEEAPPDAVYKAADLDEWITVGMMANADQQRRVRAYAAALIEWRDALKDFQPAPQVQPLNQAPLESDPEQADAAGEFEYTVTFVARISGTVRAPSFREAMGLLAPPQHTGTAGLVDVCTDDLLGVSWRLNFDPVRAELATTDDPRERQPHPPVAPVVEPVPGASPATPAVPRGGVVIRRKSTDAAAP
ncbi:hypothetical protein ACFVXC_05450 [Streptomyces sp. NPDC058257]|uniref:hypothetical protein n=1 Tax=Streptomyces sp. NPDC058257 TaxID=3346409 RepID=UPI0036E3FE6F